VTIVPRLRWVAEARPNGTAGLIWLLTRQNRQQMGEIFYRPTEIGRFGGPSVSERRMNKRASVVCAIGVGLFAATAACADPYNPGERALGGGLVGAGTGAVIGAIAGGGRGAGIGAAVGGGIGAVAGAATTPARPPRSAYRRHYHYTHHRYY
jgi:hypothetical protein